MNWVAPIKDKETLEKYKCALKDIDLKYYILFIIGVGTGMQLQDILQLRVRDIKNRDELTVKIGSQQSVVTYPIPEDFKRLLNDFVKDRSLDAYLFTGYASTNKPLSREQTYRIFKQAGASIGLKSIGTQTMRKTFAWHYYNNTGDIEYIRKLLNHASPSITFRYIGEKPNIQTLCNQLSDDSNMIAMQYLLTNRQGIQNIDELIGELKKIRRQLTGKPMPAENYGRINALLEQIRELFQDYHQFLQ